MLKSTITHLYTNEGRSISYISRLLDTNRKTLSDKIKKEWCLVEPKPIKYLSPSNQKFVNKHRKFIKDRLDSDVPVTQIAKELNVGRDKLQNTIIPKDNILHKAHIEYINRIHTNAQARKEQIISDSSRDYDFEDLPNEEWRPIMGYSKYMVSNMGRVKAVAKRHKRYYLLTPYKNKTLNRVYICLVADNNKRKNMILARVVAHTFVDGFSETNNTVNHIDGDTLNNKASNLEWVSQSENNKHAYKSLNRTKVNFKRYRFDKILYKDKYEFKTVVALARFIGKSETQTRRYLDEPERHDIKLI